MAWSDAARAAAAETRRRGSKVLSEKRRKRFDRDIATTRQKIDMAQSSHGKRTGYALGRFAAAKKVARFTG